MAADECWETYRDVKAIKHWRGGCARCECICTCCQRDTNVALTGDHRWVLAGPHRACQANVSPKIANVC